MMFEKVHTVDHYYDGVRSGTADYGGSPHYFSSLINQDASEFSDKFRLYPVDAAFMERVLRDWKRFRAWEAKFYQGLAPLDAQPGDAEDNDVCHWLDAEIKRIAPLPSLFIATFRACPGQEDLAPGILRELEVAWTPVS